MEVAELQAALLTLDSAFVIREKTDRPSLKVPPQKLLLILKQLKEDPRFSFDMLCDHTAIDWLAENRFELLYQLHSTTRAHSCVVSSDLAREKPSAPTVAELWPVAHWQEREVFDLFGILYENHTDLRRLFLEDDWIGHPLRKDYKDEFMLERPW